MSEKPSRSTAFRSLVLWISSGRGVIYANSAFCEYIGLPVEQIVGRDPRELAALASGEIADFFEDPQASATPNRLLADAESRIFELKTACRQGVTDLIFDEVSSVESLENFLAPVTGIPFDQLVEDELRTARIPDLRFVTCFAARMKSSSAMADKIPPLEHRVITGAFLEESAQALLEHQCTLLPSRGSTCAGFAGAPRYHADHSLRALEAAFEILWRMERVRSFCLDEGRDIPPVACGLASGNAIAGGFGSGRTAVYLAEGDCLDSAESLSRIASPGEILLTQSTLDHLVLNLPQGWHATLSESNEEPDLSPYTSHAGSVIPLENPARVFSVGFAPEADEMEIPALFRFEEIWRLDQGNAHPLPVFRALRLSDAAPAPSGETVLESGFVTRLGKYRLAEVIGSGGMGRVWKAQDAYGNTVAIKTLHPSTAESPDSIKRFRREAEIMSRIPHRNICRIFETGEHDGTHFIVMEYVEGLTLSEILHADAASTASRSGKSSDLPSLIAAVRKNRSSIARSSESTSGNADPETTETESSKDGFIIPVDQAIGLMEKVCEAVEFAHQHGILHRDLKPGNILLRADADPLVADFGLAKLSAESGSDKSASLSLSGHVLGTVENMAPEQAESSKNIDARADVYALGTILYQMCTGRKHFAATGNFIADIQALQTHEPLRPRAVNPSLDPDLEVIILKCLRTSPDERYRGVSALLADLQRFRRGEPIAARPVTALDLARKIIRRNRAASLVAAVSLLLILLLVTGSIWSLSHQLAQAKAARQLAEQNRLLAEQKEEEARVNAANARSLAEEVQENFKKATEAQAQLTKQSEVTEAERKKREEVEAAIELQKKEMAENLAKLNAQVEQAEKNRGKALTARLIKRTLGKLFINGEEKGEKPIEADTIMEVLREEETQVLLRNPYNGEQWFDKNLVNIEREKVTSAPQPTPVQLLSEDLSTGTSARKYRSPRPGKIYQATGINGANSIFLVTELSPNRLGFEWRAPSLSNPEGIGGSGFLDPAKGDSLLEAGPVKVAWNNSSMRLEYHPDKGTLVNIELDALQATPWAKPLAPLAESLQKSNAAAEPTEPEDPPSPASRRSIPEITHVSTPLKDTPLPELRQLADSGDPVAQVELGHRNLNGKGVVKNPKAAAEWYQKASAQGVIEADMCLGRLHWRGLTDLQPANWRNAFEVFDRLAKGESKSSKHFAAMCHLLGRGTPLDYRQAAFWFTESINNPVNNYSLADSHWELGRMHENGKGFAPDLKKAINHYKQAAASSHPQALDHLRTLSESSNPDALEALRQLADRGITAPTARRTDTDEEADIPNPPAAPDPPELTQVLLEKTIHIGDHILPDFTNPRPDARDFKASFDLRTLPKTDIHATVLVAHLVPSRHPDYLLGRYKTSLLVNNTEVQILNNLLAGTEDSHDIARLHIPIPKKLLRLGRNTLAINPGKNGSNLDDFELHRVILSAEPDTSPLPSNTAPATATKFDITLRGVQIPISRLLQVQLSLATPDILSKP